MASGVEEVASGQCLVASGVEEVASGQCLVDSERNRQQPLPSTNHWSLTPNHSPLSPEEIKICDPACGSGHMLTYAFDLLYAIYEEEGYSPSDIPTMILTRNLYGIEIDERAGTLAAFALVMKAREKQRRFFRNPIEPNICILENVRFESEELKSYLNFVGRDLFTSNLVETLHQFEEADNFGSLIRPTVTDVSGMLDILRAKDAGGNIFLYQTHEKVLRVLKQADYLSPKYHVAIANPPYMDNKGMNSKLKVFLQENYLEVKSNLFSSFVLRCLELTIVKCFTGFMTPFVWMFLSSYEKLRLYILNNFTLTSLVKPSYTAFFDSAIVAVCAFVVHKNYDTNYKGIFIDLDYLGTAEEQSPRFLQRKKEKQYYLASAADFKKIPGAAIAYWLSNRLIDIFATSSYLEDFAEVKVGLQTGDNDRFLRLWFEVSNSNIGFGMKNRKEAQESSKKWFPYNKGGEFRKWYGNQEYIVNWKNNGYEIRNFGTEDGGKSRSRPQNTDYYFQESITWSFVSSSCFGVRFSPKGFIFDVGGSSLFTEKENKFFLTSLLCSKIAFDCMKVMNPTLNFQVGNVANIPVVKFDNHSIDEIGEKTIKISTQDWNSYETAWDFTILPLLTTAGETSKLSEKYQQLRQQWQETILEMQRLEEENNRIFIEAYGLKDELTPEVPLKEITLTCNPYYRYNADKFPEELETLLLADTMREFISYSVGCMFGRYSLDKPGLILANQGDTLEDYFKKVAGEKVDSDQWLVDSEEREFNDQQLIKTQNDGKQLQGSDSVAEIDGSSRTSLSGDETISQRGALRIDQSITEGSCIDTVEHSGGTSAPIDGGIQEFSIDSQGISSGSGNSTTNSGSTLLPLSTTTLGNYVSSSRNQQNDPRSNEKTNHWPLTPNHLSFIPTETNVIPILEGEWFADDISERFKQFLLVTFGQEHYAENLKFIYSALGIKKDIREYFLKDFYNDHVKRYKKRPIYWLFSSPKGSFSALIYLHRYRLDTVSVILNDYLREYRTKLTSRKDNLQQIERGANITATEKTKAIKEIEKLNKVIQELEDYERDILYPLATRQLQIDLDDGVKVNYSKFGKALKTITGMTKESD